MPTSPEAFKTISPSQNKSSLKSIRKPLCNEDVSVKKPFHAVCKTSFCLSVKFTARFIHTLFPAHIRERVDLTLQPVLLILDHQFLLEFSINLGVAGGSSKRHFDRKYVVFSRLTQNGGQEVAVACVLMPARPRPPRLCHGFCSYCTCATSYNAIGTYICCAA